MNPFSKLNLPLYQGKSKIVKWVQSDSQKKFEENFKEYSDSIHLQNYKKNPIEYKLNNYGFRTDDNFVEGDAGTVYLGCSNTFGVGHHLKDIWSWKLHEKIGEGKFFNISHGSTGLTSQYYFLKYFSNKLKFKKVYHFYPTECHYRYGFMNSNGEMRILGKFRDDDKSDIETYLWKEYLVHESYNIFHNNVYIDAIRNICKDMNCEYISCEKTWVSKSDPYHKSLTPARDLMHYYVEHQHEVYETFLKLSNHKTHLI